MESDVFYTVNHKICFKNIKSIDDANQAIHNFDSTINHIYNVCIWREFKTQYNTWKLEQNQMKSETFIIRGHDYKFSDVLSVSPDLYIVLFEHTYEQLTPEKFGDFLIAYGNWIKENASHPTYTDGWYQAKDIYGFTRVFRIVNNHVRRPSQMISSLDNYKGTPLHKTSWTDIKPIDPNTDEFFKLLEETIK